MENLWHGEGSSRPSARRHGARALFASGSRPSFATLAVRGVAPPLVAVYEAPFSRGRFF